MGYSIARAHIRDLKSVKPFWKSMVKQYSQALGDNLPVRSPEDAWQRRHQEYLTWINDGNGVIYVATNDDTNEAIGYAALYFAPAGSTFDTGERMGELETLAVDPAYRGQGVGMKLLEACRVELRKRNITHWSLNTLASNETARHLYEKAGFEPLILRMVQRVDSENVAFDDTALTTSLPLVAPRPDAVGGIETTVDGQVATPGGDRQVSASTPPARETGVAAGSAAAAAPAAPSGPDPAIAEAVNAICRRAQVAARPLALVSRADKDRALRAMADALDAASSQIMAANVEDLTRGSEAGMSQSLLDRLRLTPTRLHGVSNALRAVADLPDPVGEVVRGSTLPNGLQLRQVRVPLGVVGIIYEARPNVTVDAAGLGLKSGNAVVLRGGSAAERTNRAIVEILRSALAAQGLPEDAVCLLEQGGRDAARALMTARGLVDVIIPRGGADLIATVVNNSTVPVIETGSGNVHVFVDASADLEEAVQIVINAKTQRPSVCNAAETLLVHADIAEEFVPDILRELDGRGVRLHGDERVRGYAERARVAVDAATATHWATEFHDLEMAVGVVDSIDEAIDHVARYSTGHTEAIVTQSRSSARRWIAEVDAAVVAVNASTRFTDGGEFGFGAEIGISTQKLHARGPMALPELTSTKWVVEGDGQVRE